MTTFNLAQILFEETGLQQSRIKATVELLEAGATVPFVARYRKEVTGELDEVQIRQLQERLIYFKELQERRLAILKSVEDQGKLTPELRGKIDACRQKTELEDLYLPYKPKRRTKATIARERGLEPLAQLLLQATEVGQDIESLALPFINPELEVSDAASALEGAGHILAEQFAEAAENRALVRELTWQQGVFCSQPARGKVGTVSKFEMYYDFREPLKVIPSHRMLAMRRGEKEDVLRLSIEAPEEEILARLGHVLVPASNPHHDWLRQVIVDAYHRLLAPSIEVELRLQAKKSADEEAIRVFAENLRNLLLAAPAGSFRVLGVDPGLRTGSKLAVVDQTGRFLEHVTIYPHTGKGRVEEAQQNVLRLIDSHQVEMVAIGNGTAGREMDQFIRQCLKQAGKKLPVVMVSEAGASVYSASDIAREEFPDLDLTVRGAISIARRLQDPLAELVKVDPKSIGVGQYQHDVSQTALKKSLDEVVESCVNYVGVDLNTASWALLGFVSGISDSLAKAIITYRNENGMFRQRKDLLNVPRFGKKAFEQAAGFLRIRDAEHILDNTAVHPERYKLVEQMASDTGVGLQKLVAETTLLDAIDLNNYLAADVGLPTLRDIIAELKKPGRDPRETFVSTSFREDVMEVTDLKVGMSLNGVVTNVAAFGAFVDIGVHQDGLVHISQLADRFVKDPNDVVKVGQQVQVRVLEVDLQRKRIGLTMRSGDVKPQGKGDGKTPERIAKPKKVQPQNTRTDLAAALEKSGFRVKKK
ncbi:Tex family protein [uncultured Desulfuromusa sp.]|uniref:Tex family protein n=1 Tax=uncultured Desulfuromusa sp. TaxID=219183 RepID=UPI002AA61454|nr:Tex family protein [uncultured Desulfuromusa sp.]